MSSQEQNELQALRIWLLTFPVVETATGHRSSRRASRTPVDLEDKAVVSAIIEVAGEICGSDENESASTSSLQGHSGDPWDTIFALTQRRKAKRLRPSAQDTPHAWPHAVQHATLAAILDGAVTHPIIDHRKEYIERIMSLSADVQRALMSLIERRKASKTPKKTQKTTSNRGKAKNIRTSLGDESPLLSPTRGILSNTSNNNGKSSTIASPEDDRRPSPRRTFDQAFPSIPSTTPSKRQSPRRLNLDASLLSPGLGDTAAVEQEFHALQEETAQLRHELAKKERREMQLQQQLEQNEADFRKKLIKVEAEASRRHDDTCADFQQQLADMKVELATMHDQHQKATRAESQLAAIQDERDILRHTQQQLVETQERLSTYREKVQHLADVKDALKREEEAHSKSVEDCLRLQNELHNLQPLQRQLDEYKERATEAEFRLTETQHALKNAQEERILNGTASNDLERTCQTQQEEIRELRLRLQQETSSKVNGAAPGVGDGLSELNPELKEEVLRLRHENERLQAFCASRQDDAVAKLEERMDDANRMTDRYKTQYLSTREQLERKQRHLATSKSREAKLRADVHEGMEKIKQTQAVLEEVSQQLHVTQEDLTASRNKETELEAEVSKWMKSAKELQEKSNLLSGDYRSCANKLDACQTREAKLNSDVSKLSEELREAQESNKTIRCELSETQDAVQAAERKSSDLRDQLDKWMSTSQKLEDRVATLNGHMDTGKSMLVQARTKEERLTAQVTQATQFLSEANNKCEELVNELSFVRQQLSETQAELSASQDCELQLQSSVSEMTQHAEAANAMSQQRKEQAQSLQEALQSSQAQIESLQAKELELHEHVLALSRRAEVSEQKSQELQSTLSETIRKLNAAKQSNDQNQEKLLSMSEQLSVKAKTIEDWKKQAIAATDEVHNLRKNLNEIQHALKDLNVDLHTSQSNEENMGESVHHAQHIIIVLEDTIEQEVQSRLQVEEQLGQAQADNATMRDEHEVSRAQLSSQIDQHLEQVAKLKQGLFQTQEALNEVKSSLNASEHREKMLQLEISRLHDDALALQEELCSTNQAMERQAAESTQLAESTCHVVEARAQQELVNLESRMNQLLAEERRAKRDSEESYQAQIKELKRTYKQKTSELQAAAQQSREETTHLKEVEMQRLRQNYEEQLANLKRISDEANSKLVARGRGMLQEVKAKAKEEHDALRKDFFELEARLAKEKEENENIVVQAKTKVGGLKKKLEFASSRINSLTNEVDELENRVKSLEREKFKLSEENDRYRRQIGGRGGPDSKLQGQFEQLQKEFKSAMEETRELRRKLKENQDINALSGIGWLESINEKTTDPSYSRNAVNQSTLVQLRTEYEETIEALNDEKRELVMKNSAAATDVQKAEKRAWECEKENAQMKQLNVSLQLQVERLAQLMNGMDDNSVPPPPPPTDASAYAKKSSHWSYKALPALESRDSMDDAIEWKTTLTEPSGICETRTLPIIDEVGDLLALKPGTDHPPSCPPDGALAAVSKARGPPSFVQFHSSSEVQPDVPPECQQS